MSLAWIVEECATPFGPVRTFNWGVPDEDEDTTNNKKSSTNAAANAKKYDNYNTDAVGFGGDDGGEGGGMDADEVALEPAQDQLGSVLWNSNTVALDHFCRFVIAQEEHDKGVSFSAGEEGGESSTKKRRTEAEGGDDDHDEDKDLEEAITQDGVPKIPAKQLAVAKRILSEKTVLELGSGVGVLGIALSLYGGCKAAITDIKELVPLMEKNIKESAKKVVALPQHVIKLTSTPSASSSGKNSKNNNSNSNAFNSQFATTLEGRGAKDLPPTDRGGICRAYAFRWGEPTPSPLQTFLGSRVQYIVMCDALYGNPSEWPKLINNLKEIVAVAKKSIAEDEKAAADSSSSDSDEDEDEKKAKKKAKKELGKKSARAENEEGEAKEEEEEVLSTGRSKRKITPYSCYKSNKLPIIVNYCEQRVDQVEGAFMALLAEKVPEWKVVGPTTLEAKSGMGMEVRVTAVYTR